MIQVKNIDGVLFRDMMIAGTTMLENNRENVDALNVFPVPDGDTGTNMSMTLASATKELNQKELLNINKASSAVAKGALKGARGNSGVILSQLFRGFARGLENVEKANPVQFANALKKGAETAYKAVMKPKEGTILTVARVIAEEAEKQAQASPDDFDALFNIILSKGEEILIRTEEMLPVLKEAGVVDAGGRGLLVIYEGFAAVLRGEELPKAKSYETAKAKCDSYTDNHDQIGDIEFAYCTEFLIQNIKTTINDEDIDRFRRRLNRIGDCVFVVNDLSVVKVHVHTNEPGKALQYAIEMGELVKIKIENMVEQRRETQSPQKALPKKDFGMVAVSLGDGFTKIFKDLAIDKIVDGGQTMNPSIEDLSKAIDSVNADCVFIFPNNSNIILAAQHAAEISKKDVRVIRTKNVAMGISAAVAFQPEADADTNSKRMQEAAECVRTGMVTYAVRDSKIGDLQILKGDIIGLHNGKISSKGNDIQEVAINLMKDIVTDDDELITVYYGSDIIEKNATEVTNVLADEYEDCDVEMQYGGQPLYYYLISVE